MAETDASNDSRWWTVLRATISKHKTYTVVPGSTSEGTTTTKQPESSSKAELGPHTDEKRMPKWLVRVLRKGDEMVNLELLDSSGMKKVVNVKVVETPGVVSALERILRLDDRTQQAYLCNPYVHQVAKLRREGSFCGYRNIQMLISFIQQTRAAGYQRFDGEYLPSILRIQEMIEAAWEQGYNTSSREEFGSLRMTRKFIGTSEVEAFFISLNIHVTGKSFLSTSEVKAWEALIAHVSDYFNFSPHQAEGEVVTTTQKPPIFLQRLGHSMTIIGIHQDTHGSVSLIVFDPNYPPPKSMRNLAMASTWPAKPEKLLPAYLYSSLELAKFNAFEIVQLDDHAANT